MTYLNSGADSSTGQSFTLLPTAIKPPEENVPVAVLSKYLHDFRSCLNIITGYSELMLDGVLGEVNGEQSESIKDILASGRHMQDLIDELSTRQDLFHNSL